MATRYTQQMKDDGIKMGAGHVVMYNNEERELLLGADSPGVFVCLNPSGIYCFANLHSCNPLSNPVELVDGAAYRYSYHPNGHMISGIYDSESESFVNNRQNYAVRHCEKIIRLVPEVKS